MIKDTINSELKISMLSSNKDKTSTLRLILAAIKDREIAAREKKQDIDDAIVMDVLSKMVKQRLESADIYKKNNRLELAAKEELEIEVIREFLPKQLTEQEIKEIILKLIEETNSSSIRDMGNIMGTLKSKYAGQLDFALAGKLLKEHLSS
ncbi:MAG: GatB/YqeY domain-containing protein [Pseudomonadota bacterium]|nr:GatB/YqeY domain-containing protein [Pseudomonadota bacterium]MEC8287694.1 GatB/YqeY domain-containing protein [Pseudomonadota bacterium]MEC8452413.1 GatB/YqeY domain-containing protein [Pseudomonadota bacterium]MEC8496994.1 GatB/YqeY domain-containing protein [Pseudomonadota bacterium]|tara:strand:+ start:5395 stop:5847 length:453 start_codon:yes stop_codon:yes gene_type:complete